MTANDLIDQIKQLPVTTGQSLIAVETQADKEQFSVVSVRFDSDSNSVIIEAE